MTSSTQHIKKEIIALSIESTHFEIGDIVTLLFKSCNVQKQDVWNWISRFEHQLNSLSDLHKVVLISCETLESYWYKLLKKFVEAITKFKALYHPKTGTSKQFLSRLDLMNQKAKIALLYLEV